MPRSREWSPPCDSGILSDFINALGQFTRYCGARHHLATWRRTLSGHQQRGGPGVFDHHLHLYLPELEDGLYGAFSPQRAEPVVMDVGPVLDLQDVIGGKACALASRAEPRDYIDVAAILHRYEPDQIIVLTTPALPKRASLRLDMDGGRRQVLVRFWLQISLLCSGRLAGSE